MGQTIAQIFGMTFVGIIMFCMGWTICSYIAEAYSQNNKIQQNEKKINK